MQGLLTNAVYAGYATYAGSDEHGNRRRIYPAQDDDLIAFLDAVPCRLRAATVKVALRTGNLKVRLDGLPDDEPMADALSGLKV